MQIAVLIHPSKIICKIFVENH